MHDTFEVLTTDHPQVFVARTPALVNDVYQLAARQQDANPPDWHAKQSDLRRYHLRIPNPVPDVGRRFIEGEMREAAEVARHLTESGMLASHREHPVPVIYAPDSGVHVGVAFGEAIGRHELFAVDRHEPLPERVLELARAYGSIVFCDSVIGGGRSMTHFLRSLPDGLRGPDDTPVNVILYANFAISDQPTANAMEHGYRVPENPHDRLKTLRDTLAAGEDKGRVTLWLSDLAYCEHDRVDRGDIIAFTQDETLRCLQAMLKKRESPLVEAAKAALIGN